MSRPVKKLVFKGVAKKQQVLLKSYLNLASHELDYDIQVVKDTIPSDEAPDLIIIEESHELESEEQHLLSLPHIVIGEHLESSSSHYLSIPIQWSDFRAVLQSLQFGAVSTVTSAVAEETSIQEIKEEHSQNTFDQTTFEQQERILPDSLQLEVDDQDEVIEEDEPVDELDVEEHNFEIGQFSEDYQGFSSSEYAKVVDDVKHFHGIDDNDAPVLLVTDDESSFSSSVLVLEADPGESWDYTDADSDFKFSEETLSNTVSASELVLTDKQGSPVVPGEELWKSDLEILSDNKSLLFIKSKRSMVYTDKPPGLWLGLLTTGKLSKVALDSNWTPFSKVSPYPISLFIWACNYALNNESLQSDLSQTDHYLLETWPSFDLLYCDNRLLKMATLLFVNPESKETLMEKSSLPESLVIGFLNACHKQGILKKAYEIDLEKVNANHANHSVFGKLKEVFK